MTVQDCPECNGYRWYDRSDRGFQNNDRCFNELIKGRTSFHNRLGGRLSVHDRLGKRIGHFPRNQEELEEMTNTQVLDKFIFSRDSNIHRMESKEVRYQPVWKTKLPQCYPKGLTRM